MFVDPPGPPCNLAVKEVYLDWITIKWDAPENDGGTKVIQYIIEKRDVTRTDRSNSKWVMAGTTGPDEMSYRAIKLFQGNAYEFRVFAENRVAVGDGVQMDKPVIAKLPYGMTHMAQK